MNINSSRAPLCALPVPVQHAEQAARDRPADCRHVASMPTADASVHAEVFRECCAMQAFEGGCYFAFARRVPAARREASGIKNAQVVFAAAEARHGRRRLVRAAAPRRAVSFRQACFED